MDLIWWARIGLYTRGLRHLPRRLRRIAYYRLLRLHEYRGARRVRSPTIWGDTMWLRPGDYVDDHILCDGVWESHVYRRLEEQVDGSGWVFDVGAHIGSFTLAAAKVLGNRGKVVAFEPTSAAFAWLAENIKLNDVGNVTLVNKAVGSTSGVFLLDGGDEHNSGRSRISAMAGQPCEMITLDEFWASAGRPPVQLVKIDVEGSELDVLLGARELLATRPRLLLELTPVGGVAALERSREVLRLAASVGYEVHRWVERSGWIGGEVPLDRQWDLWLTVPSRQSVVRQSSHS